MRLTRADKKLIESRIYNAAKACGDIVEAESLRLLRERLAVADPRLDKVSLTQLRRRLYSLANGRTGLFVKRPTISEDYLGHGCVKSERGWLLQIQDSQA